LDKQLSAIQTFLRTSTSVCLLAGALLAAGCDSLTDNQSPKELLSMSVSGLAGIDSYSFIETSGVTSAAGIKSAAVTYRGEVQEHNRMLLQSEDNRHTRSVIPPLELLTAIEAGASHVELLPSKSGLRTAVLRVDLDSAAAVKQWEAQLNASITRLDSLNSPLSQTGGSKTLSSNQNKSSEFDREWAEEIARSKSTLNDLLRNLHVESFYLLTIDRKRLLPLKLQEHTVLHYEAKGAKRKEILDSELIFATSR